MHVLLTEATGYMGSAVLKALIQGGHSVAALVRAEDAADRLRGPGAVDTTALLLFAALLTARGASCWLSRTRQPPEARMPLPEALNRLSSPDCADTSTQPQPGGSDRRWAASQASS
ncbi:NmrA family NAD(P)-binding protein [Arthrobacter sp. MSA 4-2]|nr:NmrA family NAD(P)-binding protein [Arthrobacter sp. MSA 4-2]